MTKLPEGGISIENAKSWTQAWQSKNPTLSKAFLIPNASILNILKEIGVLVPDGRGGFTINAAADEYGIRAYIGIGPDPETGADEEKLVMVGTVDVNGDYQDQVLESKNSLQVELLGSGAFDLTRPCPKKCDLKSPLNHK